jgi:hypothetical protein
MLWQLPAVTLAEPPADELLKLHAAEAGAYQIFRDDTRTEPLALTAKPIFNWTNLLGEHTQFGHLFVWTHAGRPEAIGTIFSTRASDPSKRILVHEFHTLATGLLFPVTPESSAYQWKPRAGIDLTLIDDAPTPAKTVAQRKQQMRSLARSFAAESRAGDGQTWQLQLLPTPLLQYEPTSDECLHGAIFAMVSSAGTDPEVLLVIEARRTTGDAPSWAWHAAALRFSDRDLVVKRNDSLLWSSLEDTNRRVAIKNNYTLIESADRTYMCYRARVIDELPEAAATEK